VGRIVVITYRYNDLGREELVKLSTPDVDLNELRPVPGLPKRKQEFPLAAFVGRSTPWPEGAGASAGVICRLFAYWW
jgi:hypothetical protein